MTALSIGDRVRLDDGRVGTVADVRVEQYPAYGRSQHDVWIIVHIAGSGHTTVPVHQIEEVLRDE